MPRHWFFAITLLAVISCSSEKKDPASITAANNDTLSRPEAKQVSGTGRIEPENGITDLASESGGLISKIFVREGDLVVQGQPLLEIGHAVSSAQTAEVSARLSAQQQQLELDRVGIAEARNNLQKAESDFGRTKRLVDRKAETQQALDDARTDLENKKIVLQQAQASLRLTEKKITEIGEQVNTARTNENSYIVRAPQGGRLLEFTARPGAGLITGQRFGQLAPEEKLTVLCEIDELFADEIRPGQPAFIRYKGYPDTISLGKVIYAAPYLKRKSLFSDEAGVKEDRRVREVRVMLDRQDLLINRQAECVIKIR
jgi:multidrug resistance efflux pump